ncbi:SGNH/GDSL hydrolase family protein [Muricoccus radiodurans]|uniref:SGNH/GDSL hydrolase family protein n=1 Tax=Muricoccus radiodurans TaxID=2231721 RepID=UPI003CEF1D66
MPASYKTTSQQDGREAVEFYSGDSTLLLAVTKYEVGASEFVETYGPGWALQGVQKVTTENGRLFTESYDQNWNLESAQVSYVDAASRSVVENYLPGWVFGGGAITYDRDGRHVTEVFDPTWNFTRATIEYVQPSGYKMVEQYGAAWSFLSATQTYVADGGTYVQNYDANWQFTSATFTHMVANEGLVTDFYDTAWQRTGTNHHPDGISADRASLSDLALPGEEVARLTGHDADAGASFLYRLVAAVGADNDLFVIDGDRLVLAEGEYLDAATHPTVQINLEVTDQFGASFTELLTFSVAPPVPTGPTVAISNHTVSENDAGGVIGTVELGGWSSPVQLSVLKVDANGQVIVEDGAPVVDGRFVVDQGVLKLAPGVSLDYEAVSSAHVMVRATAESGFYKDQPVEIAVENVNPWEGKTYGVIGDSITYWNFYQNMVSQAMDAPLVINDGIEGRQMTDALIREGGGHAFDNVDLLAVFLGTNDYGGNHALGSYSDPVTAGTFYASTRQTIETILAEKPSIELVMVTPLVRGDYPGQPVNPGPNATGAYLWQYVEAIKEVAQDYHVPVLDLYHDFAITMDNLDVYTVDNLHPNYQGHELIAKEMVNFFELL